MCSWVVLPYSVHSYFDYFSDTTSISTMCSWWLQVWPVKSSDQKGSTTATASYTLCRSRLSLEKIKLLDLCNVGRRSFLEFPVSSDPILCTSDAHPMPCWYPSPALLTPLSSPDDWCSLLIDVPCPAYTCSLHCRCLSPLSYWHPSPARLMPIPCPVDPCPLPCWSLPC